MSDLQSAEISTTHRVSGIMVKGDVEKLWYFWWCEVKVGVEKDDKKYMFCSS